MLISNRLNKILRVRTIKGLLRLYSALLIVLPVSLVLLPTLLSDSEFASRHLALLLLACATASVLITAPLGIMIAMRIEEPLRKLSEMYKLIQEGHFDQSLDLEDFKTSPLELKQLGMAFNRMAETIREHIATIEEIAVTDQLTGVPNRRQLLSEGHRLLHMAIRSQTPMACLLIDIDHFKEVNDSHGHIAGDRFLMHITGIIMKNIRGSDLMARYGGEEFVVLATNSSMADAQQLAERIRSEVQATPLIHEGVAISRTVSVGVAEYSLSPIFGSNVLEDMLDKADKAMYQAKKNGRNLVVVWDEGISAPPAPG
ncbi:MAG: GGDEF domain-containing protein [Desulfovibrionaceae bacterium]|nr:GGDEF domain-containing protein [Desulfovibrionaceae bacterium]